MSAVETRWRRALDDRAGAHVGVALGAVELTEPVRRAVAPSLATFQVGESGTGEHLLAAAHAVGASVDHVAALRAFVVEEQEHARLLALALDALNEPLRTGHWTDRVFVVLRRVKSLRTEVLTLLVAEVIALRYYSAMRDGIGDPGLRDVFARIHADEVVHVDFHGETLPPYLRRFGRLTRLLVRVLWNVLVTGTSVVVAIDHGAALRAVGVGRLRFVREVWPLRADLDRRLFSSQRDADPSSTRGSSASVR